jgi:CelD/BcsL family acetyltransferase involved in cellulose biosynthesis
MQSISLDHLNAEDMAAWDRLGARAAEPNPFFERFFVLAAASSLEVAGIALLVVEEDGEWLGCMPVTVRRTLGVAIVASTWKHPYSFLGTPLVDRDRVEDFAVSLVAALRAREQSHYLMLRRAANGPVMDAVRAAAEGDGGVAPLFERDVERGAYRRRDEGEQLSWLKSKRRSELKRQRRKLADEVGGEVVVRDCSDDPSAVDAFLALESSGWKGEGGTALASSERSTELFRLICGELGNLGRLQLRALEAGERSLAMTCDIGAGEVLFGFKSAYDEGLRRYSPGIQLQADNFAHFDRKRGEALFDSCAEPDNETINGLWPDRRPLTTIVLGRRGPGSGLLGRILDTAYETRAKRTATGSGSGHGNR